MTENELHLLQLQVDRVGIRRGSSRLPPAASAFRRSAAMRWCSISPTTRRSSADHRSVLVFDEGEAAWYQVQLDHACARQPSCHCPNVSRSLHTMAEFGLVKFVKNGRTVIPQTTFEHLSVDFC